MRAGGVDQARVDPVFDGLRDEERFAELVETVGAPKVSERVSSR